MEIEKMNGNSTTDKEELEKKGAVFDDLLTTIGGFGRYQQRIYLLLCLPCMVCALHKLAWVFLGAQAAHRCLMPYEDPNNATFSLSEAILNMSLPRTQTGFSQCERLDANFTEEYFLSGIPASASVYCSAWVFDKQQYQSSAVFEFELVCDKAWLRAFVDTMLMFGNLIGSVIFGELSDRYGRRPVFFFSLVLQVVAGLVGFVSPEYWSFVVARAVVGATVPGIYIVGYVIGIEMVGPGKRQYAGVLLQMSFTVGYMVTALFAYLITDWRYLQLALTLPGLFFLVYWWFIPESPRWLLGQSRITDATKIIQKASKENKSEINASDLERLVLSVHENVQRDTQMEKQKQKASLIEVIKYPNLRINTLIILMAWCVLSMSYYGLSWNTGNLGGNIYINFVISGAVEFPAYIFVMLGLNRWGRRPMLCGTLLVGGIALVVTVFVPEDPTWMLTTLAMLGKMALTSSFGVIYLFSSEIFPTSIRNAGMGASSMLNGVGGMLAPFVILLSEVWTQLPFLILGALALLIGVAALRLPETLNQDLPETIQDGEMFGKKKKYTQASNGTNIS